MAKASVNTVRIRGIDGDVADVTSNRLDVNAYLSATPTIDIGDVSLLLGGTAASVNNGAADATTLRVTVASDSTGVLSVDDNGSSLTVDNSHLTNLGSCVYQDDQDGFTLGGDNGIAIMGFAGTQTVNANDMAVLQCDTSGRLMVEIDSTTPDSDTCFQINGEAWGNLDIGVGVYAVRNDTLAALTNVADGDYTPFQVDADGALYIAHGVTGGADGIKVVTTAGTDVVLASSTACRKVDIQAQTDNTGLIAVGFTGVDATEATGTGVILYAGDTYSLEVNNLNLIYLDSTVSGEGVRYTYFT